MTPKLTVEPTSSANLEAKFDFGEDVLDYFDLSKAVALAPEDSSHPPNPSVARLKEAIQIVREIEKLQKKLRTLFEPGRSVGKIVVRH